MNKLACVAALALVANATVAKAQGEQTLFSSDWASGIDKRIQFQQPVPESIAIVSPGPANIGPAIKVTIEKNQNYGGVANGTPRAEISFNGFLHFAQGKEYIVDWETYIPESYVFDSQQPELISQIHQGPPAGYPPFALFISNSGKYEVHNRTQSPSDYVTADFGNPAADRGRVVHWQLYYVPDGSGAAAITELKMDGHSVFSIKGVPNAYKNDDMGYLKLGLYKADWTKKPSDVVERTLYYGSVTIKQKN